MEFTDLATIALLVLLEAVLSADNALVLAVLVLPLPRKQHRKALQYGIVGAFVFRIVCIVFAAHLLNFHLFKLVGAAYLFYLPLRHFFGRSDSEQHRYIKPAKAMLGLSIFWSVVVRVELTDIVFAIDSILVAVAISSKVWVVITGGILGVIAIRVVIGQVLVLIEAYPAIVDGADVIVAWVAVKLLIEYLHSMQWIGWEIPKVVSLGLIGIIFFASLLYARKKKAAELTSEAETAREVFTTSDWIDK